MHSNVHDVFFMFFDKKCGTKFRFSNNYAGSLIFRVKFFKKIYFYKNFLLNFVLHFTIH